MKIYQLVEDNNMEWEDNNNWTMLITENKHIVLDKCIEKIDDEDFTTEGYKRDYLISIIVWENGKSERIWVITTHNKMETLNFLDEFTK